VRQVTEVRPRERITTRSIGPASQESHLDAPVAGVIPSHLNSIAA
jgi:hypothetical protein